MQTTGGIDGGAPTGALHFVENGDLQIAGTLIQASDVNARPVDADGVALAAIQALAAKNDQLAAQADELAAENDQLAKRTDALTAENDQLRLEMAELRGLVEDLIAGA